MRRKNRDDEQLTFGAESIGEPNDDLLSDIETLLARQKNAKDIVHEESERDIRESGGSARETAPEACFCGQVKGEKEYAPDAGQTCCNEDTASAKSGEQCNTEQGDLKQSDGAEGGEIFVRVNRRSRRQNAVEEPCAGVDTDIKEEPDKGGNAFEPEERVKLNADADNGAQKREPIAESGETDGRSKDDNNGEISIEINRDELLRKQRVAMFTKPKMLLETPYNVTVGNKQYTRYRLEYDKPDKTIPPEISSSAEVMIPRIDQVDEEAAEEQRQKQKKAGVGREIASWVLTIAVAVIIALLVRTFVFVFVQVDGPSMLDTLHTENRLFVWRAGYIFNQPERGDIVICHYPVNGLYTDTGKNYVKRVIALPGETISIIDGTVYINGDALDEPYLTAERGDSGSMNPVTLGEDEFFVMGDNRVNSGDSRAVGPIKRGDIVGKALQIIYPFDEFGPLES